MKLTPEEIINRRLRMEKHREKINEGWKKYRASLLDFTPEQEKDYKLLMKKLRYTSKQAREQVLHETAFKQHRDSLQKNRINPSLQSPEGLYPY